MPTRQGKILESIIAKIRHANKVYIIGDGGSASMADHFACDLLKNCQIPAISLCSNSAIITAIANDYSFEHVFEMQLKILLEDLEDILVIFSTRGNSPNLIKAAKYAKRNNSAIIIGVAGYGGGKLKALSEIFFDLQSDNMQECEDRMSKFCHRVANTIIAKSLMEEK